MEKNVIDIMTAAFRNLSLRFRGFVIPVSGLKGLSTFVSRSLEAK
jgi:hypothetical protein